MVMMILSLTRTLHHRRRRRLTLHCRPTTLIPRHFLHRTLRPNLRMMLMLMITILIVNGRGRNLLLLLLPLRIHNLIINPMIRIIIVRTTTATPMTTADRCGIRIG